MCEVASHPLNGEVQITTRYVLLFDIRTTGPTTRVIKVFNQGFESLLRQCWQAGYTSRLIILLNFHVGNRILLSLLNTGVTDTCGNR